ncbi:MAG: hypothetical protein ABJA76_08380 [Mucilaginibacter sp.]
MARILIIIAFTLIGVDLYGQSRVKPCLYVDARNSYILSEAINFDRGNGRSENETFNSLFIWQNDRVIRVVFEYLKRVPANINAGQLQTLSSFIPPFKKYSIVNNSRPYWYVYGGRITYHRQNEKDGENYSDLLKSVINNWNKKYNPLADQFGIITVYDADPHVLYRNKKRKQENINILPILLRSGNSDSLYMIKPNVINVYRLDNNPLPNISNTKRYTLYSTVSFAEYGFIDDYSAYWNSGRGFISDNTLPYLYNMPLPLPADSLLNMLATLPMAQPQFKETQIAVKIDEVHYVGDEKTVAIYKKRDSIAAARNDSLQKIIAADCFGLYQYCPECLNDKTPKLSRIKKHCPVNISPEEFNTDENWSYAFSSKTHHYFKAESPNHVENRGPAPEPYYQYPGETMPHNYLFKWLLMSPGVGYWMTDVSKFSMKYFIPDGSNTNLKLNGRYPY